MLEVESVSTGNEVSAAAWLPLVSSEADSIRAARDRHSSVARAIRLYSGCFWYKVRRMQLFID